MIPTDQNRAIIRRAGHRTNDDLPHLATDPLEGPMPTPEPSTPIANVMDLHLTFLPGRTYTERRRRLRSFIWHRDAKRCGICGKGIRRLVDMHMDHLIQLHDGGATVPENLRATHVACNQSRPRGPRGRSGWAQHPDRKARDERKVAQYEAKRTARLT